MCSDYINNIDTIISSKDYVRYRNTLLEDVYESVYSLNEDSFRVKMNKKYVHQFKNKDEWDNIDSKKFTDIKTYISPLIVSLSDDELAKRFDNLMLNISLANLQNKNANKPIKRVIQTAESLSKLGTIPQVVAKKALIDRVMTEEFWESVDIFELERVRIALRDLIKFIEKILKRYITQTL